MSNQSPTKNSQGQGPDEPFDNDEARSLPGERDDLVNLEDETEFEEDPEAEDVSDPSKD